MPKPTHNMETIPKQEYEQICASCELMQMALSEPSPNDLTLGEYRARCAACRKIYKFDAILRGFEQSKKQELFGGKRNVGKKSKITIHERQSIKELHAQGKSIRELADLFHYNKNTINKIIKE